MLYESHIYLTYIPTVGSNKIVIFNSDTNNAVHVYHPAGDVIRVSVMPRKVRVIIGDADIKINEKRQKFLFVQFYLEYPLSLKLGL